MRKALIGLLIAAVICGLLVWASFTFDFNLGPPLYERHSAEYLSAHGFGTNVISALLAGTPIDHETVLALQKLPDVSVRHMLGRNRHLSQDERQTLLHDTNEFVRQGAAMNPALTPEEINGAMTDHSDYVLSALAMNPSTPENSLLALRDKYRIGLIFFAQNPNCPASIVKEIEDSNDSTAKSLLRIHGKQ
jgi:hypothetical protein